MNNVDIFLQKHSCRKLEKIFGIKKSQIAKIKKKQRPLTTLEATQCHLEQGSPIFKMVEYRPDEQLFWRNLDQLQALLAVSENEMSSLFHISERSYKYYQGACKSLPYENFKQFTLQHATHPVLWFTEIIDLNCLYLNLKSPFHKHGHIPHRFEGTGSQMRTLSNLIQYLKVSQSIEVAEAMQLSFQISDEALSFDRPISIRIFADFHKRLRKLGASDELFIEMGKYNKHNLKNLKIFKDKLPNYLKNSPDVISYFIQKFVNKIDMNKDYTILETTHNTLVFKAKPTQQFLKAFQGSSFSDYEIALYVQGHTYILPTYFNLPAFQHVELEFNPSNGEALYLCRTDCKFGVKTSQKTMNHATMDNDSHNDMSQN